MLKTHFDELEKMLCGLPVAKTLFLTSALENCARKLICEILLQNPTTN